MTQPPDWAPPPSAPPPGWGPPPGYGAPRTETKAMIALGLSIAAWTPTIPFLGAIAALFLSRMARRDILASGGALKGLDLCTWANVIAIVHLVVVGLALAVLLLLFVLPFAFTL